MPRDASFGPSAFACVVVFESCASILGRSKVVLVDRLAVKDVAVKWHELKTKKPLHEERLLSGSKWIDVEPIDGRIA